MNIYLIAGVVFLIGGNVSYLVGLHLMKKARDRQMVEIYKFNEEMKKKGFYVL